MQARVRESGAVQAVTGFTRDVSRDGLFIQMRSPFRPTTRVDVELLYKHSPIELHGVVVRSARVPHHLQALQASGMGVKVLRSSGTQGALPPPTPAAVKLTSTSSPRAVDPRTARITVGTEIPVYFGREKRLLALHDLSDTGAAFVCTSEIPDAALLRMRLPLSDTTEEVEVEAVPVRTRSLGGATILAVRFVHVPREVETKIRAFVDSRTSTAQAEDR